MDQITEFTLEEEFNLRQFSDEVQRMSLEQAQEFLLFQRRHMMVQEKLYREILKQEWKLDEGFASLQG